MNLLNQQFKHRVFGIGTVVEQTEGQIVLSFDSKTSKFLYNEAAFSNFLTAVDSDVQAAIMKEFVDKKAAETLRLEEERRRREEIERERQEKERQEREQKEKEHNTPARTPKPYVPYERVTGKPLTFYVFQGDTFKTESEHGFIWAPKTNQAGLSFFHWDNLMKVHTGDIVLHGVDGTVGAVSIAVSDCYDCKRPEERIFGDLWEDDGRKVNLAYTVFTTPVKTSDFRDQILEYSRAKYSPFDSTGNGNMGYLYELNPELAKVFLRAAMNHNPEIEDLDYVLSFLADAE